MANNIRDLSELRKELDVIDTTIITSFEKRMGICSEIAEYKSEKGSPIQDVERERQKIESVVSQVNNDEIKDDAAELFEQIMSLSRKLQYQILAQKGIVGAIPFEMLPIIPKQKARVVFQGVPGAHSQSAMFEYFGKDVSNFSVKTFDEAMKAICAGIADYAVLPIENSTAGQVGDVYDLLMHYDNYIVGEIFHDVKHVLLGVPGAKLEDIQCIYSHPQGLLQCSEFLEEHNNIAKIGVENTAMAAKKLADDGDKTHGAIAGAACAELYGLEVIDDDIVDNKNNTTRFIIVSSKKIYTEAANKVSVVFEANHTTGSLYRLMSHISHNNLNMTKIESRPVPGKIWEYRFFVDFEGNLSDSSVKNALRSIIQEAIYFKILGNY